VAAEVLEAPAVLDLVVAVAVAELYSLRRYQSLQVEQYL
jgi:hypothetical protein